METALCLDQVTGVPAAIWNNLELNYRAYVTRCVELQRLERDSWTTNSVREHADEQGISPVQNAAMER